MGEVMVFLSGKGGTGKTSLCAAIATALASEGKSVLCIDCDVGLRNLDLALGVEELSTLSFWDVCSGGYSLKRATEIPAYPAIKFLTAPMNVSLEQVDQKAFSQMLTLAKQHFDYVLLDAPSGVGTGFLITAHDADRGIVVSGYDPASLRNAARAVQELELMGKTQVQLIVNRLQKKKLSELKLTVDDIMDRVGAPLLGIVPEDDGVLLAASGGKPLLKQTKKGAAAACIRIAKRIQGKQEPISI